MSTREPFTSPESRAALALVKDHVASVIPTSYFDREALRLVGASREIISREIDALRREFIDGLEKQPEPLCRTRIVAFGVAFADLLAERIGEMESQEGGTA